MRPLLNVMVAIEHPFQAPISFMAGLREGAARKPADRAHTRESSPACAELLAQQFAVDVDLRLLSRIDLLAASVQPDTSAGDGTAVEVEGDLEIQRQPLEKFRERLRSGFPNAGPASNYPSASE